jgi:DNA-binding TFAR19-related protein (PDSD5 family)
MFDRVKNQMMTRHYSKGKEAAVMTGILTPKIKKKLDKNIELANNSFAEGAGEVVCSTPTNYIVDLKSRTCTCKR